MVSKIPRTPEPFRPWPAGGRGLARVLGFTLGCVLLELGGCGDLGAEANATATPGAAVWHPVASGAAAEARRPAGASAVAGPTPVDCVTTPATRPLPMPPAALPVRRPAEETALASRATAHRGDALERNNPAAEPHEAEAHTLAGRYLRSAEADALAARRRGAVVWVVVPCCGPEHRETAILSAFGMQAAQNLPDDVPFLVGGTNLREAAVVADRLTRGGLPRVVLVTP